MSSEVDLGDVQGNILHSYRLDHAVHFLLHASSRKGALALLQEVVAHGVTKGNERGPQRTLNIAITYAGFERLGLRRTILEDFPEAFRQGSRRRAKRLGDIGRSEPVHWDGPHAKNVVVHFVLTVHAPGEDGAYDSAKQDCRAWLDGLADVQVLHEQETKMLSHAVEHFGFADGASQPVVEGVPTRADETVRGGGTPLPGSRWQPLKAGEFLLGHPNEDGTVDERPDADLVRNGTYVVYRKLEQDVAGFRKVLERAAQESGLSVEHVAAKIVGRWRDGVPLELEPRRTDVGNLADKGGEKVPLNDFRYLPHDREGFVCPRGAHIRRTNPRDAIEFGDTVADTGVLASRHRIIRRGMPYGEPLDPEATKNDKEERGLIFICYNADIERQFELIQGAWCCDGDAFFLGEDQDLLLANELASPKMTIPMRDAPPKLIRTQPDLVITRGSEYLFAPGLDALHRLAQGEFR